jgi:hypothetical protein
MTDPITAVEAFLASGQVIHTRLRERATDEVLDLLPVHQPAIPDVSLADVVAALVTLEQRGVARRAGEKICAHDSTEYLVTWCSA